MLVTNVAVIAAVSVVFDVLHSLTAGHGFKQRLEAYFGSRLVQGWYRLAYNIFSAVLLLPVLALLIWLPDRNLYTVPSPWGWFLTALQLIGILGLAGALFVTDVWHFAGVRQAIAYLRGESLPLQDPPLTAVGMYRYTRHPLYFFSLLVLWAVPTMSLNWLLIGTGATVYILIGSRLEEKRLLRIYGEEYQDYRRTVSWILPLPVRRAPSFTRRPDGGQLKRETHRETQPVISQEE
jgi:protein-S-isoprenylcysteine O-methyltransferase Ste14